MKPFSLATIALAISFIGCSSSTKTSTNTDSAKSPSTYPALKAPTDTINVGNKDQDKTEIRNLIRAMLIWADSKEVISVLPAISKDSIYIGFDLDQVNRNTDTLKATGFFTNEFIQNYQHILQTLDKKIRSNKFEKWKVGDLPTFAFANDASPWCSCQDNYPWENVDIADLKLSGNAATASWNWGELPENTDPTWKEASIPFRAVKEDGQWKIAYLKGFDYKESVQM